MQVSHYRDRGRHAYGDAEPARGRRPGPPVMEWLLLNSRSSLPLSRLSLSLSLVSLSLSLSLSSLSLSLSLSLLALCKFGFTVRSDLPLLDIVIDIVVDMC
jgi:hypothetical protein